MSSTRTFTPMTSPTEGGTGIRVTDLDAFETHMSELSDKAISPITYTSKTKDESEYPHTYTEYTYLQGFTAYPNQTDRVDETSVLKLENFGYEYDQSFFIEFWERVATYCDAFEFVHSPANHFPSIADVATEGWPDYVYSVSCDDGVAHVSRLDATFEETDITDGAT